MRRRWIRELGLLVALAAMMILGGTAASAASRWGAGYIPNVTVVTQDGQQLKFYDDVIKGKIVVISFIYTTCRDICPLVTARLQQVYERLGDSAGRDIHFVSISIDPDHDTPEKMKEHATAFNVAPGWLFLTGMKKDIDVIRYKLGERSQKRNEHSNDILLGNDATGEWAHDSAFADLGVLAANIHAMDPAWRATMGKPPMLPTTAPQTARGGLPGQGLFTKLCASCHSVGKGDRAGPDLFGVFSRREPSWIERYIAQPDQVRAAQDPIAAALGARFQSVRMPNFGLSAADISDLMLYLRSASSLPPADPRVRHSHRH
jgi:protein SCO1